MKRNTKYKYWIYAFIMFFCTCSKDIIPSINNIEIIEVSIELQKCIIRTEVFDLSSIVPTKYGIYIYSNLDTLKPDTVISLNFPVKGKIDTFIFINNTCDNNFFARSFYQIGNDIHLGQKKQISFNSANFSLPTIVKPIIFTGSDSIIFIYKLPNYYNVSVDEIGLYHNSGSNTIPFQNPFPSGTKKKLAIQSNILDSFVLTNVSFNQKYKFQICVSVCNKYYCVTDSISILDSSACNYLFDELEYIQQSKSEVRVTCGIVNPKFLPSSYGFCLGANCNFAFNETAQPVNKFTEVLVFNPGEQILVSAYATCPQTNKRERSNSIPIKIMTPILILDPPLISGHFLTLKASFNIVPYLSMDYGLCYSLTNPNPTARDSRIRAGSDYIGASFSYNFLPPSNGKYNITAYLIDSDDTIYSAPKQIYFDNASPCRVIPYYVASYDNYATKSVACFLLNDQLFAGGGINSNANFIPSFYQYNESVKSWSVKSAMPITSSKSDGIAAFFSYQNQAYVLEKNKTTIWEYSPVGDKWTSVNPIPSNEIRQDALGINNSNRSFIIGGEINGSGVNDMLELVVINGSYNWIQRPFDPKMKERIGAGGFVINEDIYIFGGNTDNALWCFKTGQNKWVQITQYPLPIELLGYYKGTSTYLNDVAYIIKDNSTLIYTFNPTGGWCFAGVYSPGKQFTSAVSNGNKAFFGFGIRDGYSSFFPNINKFK